MPEDLRMRISEILGKLPKPADVERYKRLGSLTPEEEKYVVRLIDKVGEINALTFIHPIINHERIDPYIRRKVDEIKEIISHIRV